MPLSAEDKAQRKRQRYLDKASEYQIGTYIRKFVAPVFQRMIRAEWGADERPYHTAIVSGQPKQVFRQLGNVVCVTCGYVDRWDSGIGGMHTGHFLASRRNAILLEADNCAVQCAGCNYVRGGAPQEFRAWMIAVRGPEVVARLEALKRTRRTFTREELVDMLIDYRARLKAAEQLLLNSGEGG